MVDYKKRGESRFWFALALLVCSAMPANAYWYIGFMNSSSKSGASLSNLAYSTLEECKAAGSL